MSLTKRLFVIIFLIFISYVYKRVETVFGPVEKPLLAEDEWWGEDEKPNDWNAYIANSSEIIGNRLVYPDETIDNLKTELKRKLRLVKPFENVGFTYGFNTNYLKTIIDYWRDDYLPRWRSREIFLWQFNHLTTDIQGLRLHFLHLMLYDDNTVGKTTYPVLLLHGWPGSVREFYELIHKLHNHDEHKKYLFNVVAPSLPGYGWSQGTSKPGLGPAQIAVILRNLMLRLGYQKFFIQGGDWGSVIGSHMATLYPENVIGFHTNLCTSLTLKSAIKGYFANLLPGGIFAPKNFGQFFPNFEIVKYIIEEAGYFHIQACKPDTIGNALTENPIGLAVYILEKFSTWTNPDNRLLSDGGLNNTFEMDALLDNIMIYYLTNSIVTSQRLYAEAYSQKHRALQLERVPTTVPTGCARFKNDLLHFYDIQLRDKYKNLIHSSYYKRGGHFAAMELPNVLYDDFITFVQKVEKFNS